jgi:hypothetical protein
MTMRGDFRDNPGLGQMSVEVLDCPEPDSKIRPNALSYKTFGRIP